MRTFAPALLLAGLCLTACNPCVERCRAESRNIEDCLDDWNLQWDDFGASDAKSFREQCVATERLWIDSLEGASSRDEKQVCWDLTDALRRAEDCAARWEALSSYGDGGV
jgi:hypothetical protein